MAYDEQELKDDFMRKSREMDTRIKIALIGQPGAGKSSLINALTGKHLFETGEHTDTTISRQEAKLGSLTIVDLPGYGTKRFPLSNWLDQYKPEELDLYLFVFDGKLHESDSDLFQHFKKWKSEREHPYFIVRNKEDQIWNDTKSLQELKNDIIKDVNSKMGNSSLTTKVYFTSCRTKEGISELKEDVLSSDVPAVLRSKMIANFKATSKEDLKRKREVCMSNLDWYAYSAAANGVNPIPGLDAGLDITIILSMFARVRNVFDLEEQCLVKYQLLLPLGRKVFDVATREGVMILLKNLGKKYVAKGVYKYIPLIGQVVSAVAGYKMVYAIGESYIQDCYELADAILERTLDDCRRKNL